jgi:hypothetical protein
MFGGVGEVRRGVGSYRGIRRGKARMSVVLFFSEWFGVVEWLKP